MKKFFIVLMSFIAFATCTLSAQNNNDAKIKAQINKAASQIRTMQCDFVQTKHLKMLNDKMVSKGKMYYQQGNKLRWEYITPYSYTFILNNSKVIIKNNKRKDVIDVKQNKMFREIARIMMNSVVGKCLSDDNDFNVSLADSNSEWIATLIAKKKDLRQMFPKIILHFNKKESMVKKVELMEKNGDKTIIELVNVSTNKNIDAKIFNIN